MPHTPHHHARGAFLGPVPGPGGARVPTVARLLGAGLLCAAVSGCSAPADKFAPACPDLGLLRDAVDITRFRPGGQDVTDMLLDGRITAVPAECSAGGRGITRARLSVTMQLDRGPAAKSPQVAVPYFVAVTDGDRVLDEQDFAIRTSFATNIDRVTVTGQEITLNIPVTPQKSAAAYKIYVGFRLGPDELALNRRRGAR